jgi:protocatechuate 3,4-dioxygenase beta subunit
MMRHFASQAEHRRFDSLWDRRRFLATMGIGGLYFTTRGAFAQALVQTPAQTIGPYYPDRLPLDLDNDLLVISDSITPAVGEISWISGRVLDSRGQPVRGALVEIWQADNNGAYIHSASPIRNRDAGFQGYGKFITGSSGEYLFRTVKPGFYPGRTRHVHYQITAPGRSAFTTQLYVQGEAMNNNDGVLNEIRDTAQRSAVVLPWTAVPGSRIGELAARFDIVLGFTPTENPAPARPTLVSMSGVVQGATTYPGAAPGAWITLFGDSLAPSTRSWQTADFVNNRLPESLDGVSVRINNKAASVYYISPKQINVLAADDTTAGSVQAVVTTAAGASDPVTVQVQKFMPGFFVLAQEYVAALRADGTYVGPAGLLDGVTTVAASPGDQVLLFGTGFGPTNPAPPAGESFKGAFPLANPATIRIDTAVTELSFAGLVSPGLYQFNVTIPDLADGDHAVTAEVGGVRTAKIGRIRIQRQMSAGIARPLPRADGQILARLLKVNVS